MTLCVAWQRELPVLGNQVILATDSMVTGGLDFPHGSKLFPFARNDCAICWEGEAFFPYATIANARNDIDYSDALSGQGTDVRGVANRIRDIVNQMWQANLNDPNSCCKDDDFSFIFAGYSYRESCPLAWHLTRPNGLRTSFELVPIDLGSPFYIGSGRQHALQAVQSNPTLGPGQILQSVIGDNAVRDVGGPPQLLTIDRRGVENVGIFIGSARFLFGKELHSSGHLSKIRYIHDITEL